ncbi:MAG: hypothetical protein GY941_17295 [Planctomycetes bacterium]|nr:hypothetical protein [Planctomycetota bacterium]
MGSKSKSSSSQTTNNYNTSFGVDGDNNGFITNGDGNSFNIQQVDGGLVQAVTDVWRDMAGNQTEMTRAAENMTADGFNFASDVNRDSLNSMADVNSDSLNFASDVNRDSLDLAGNLFADSMRFGRDSINVAGDALTDAFAFGQDSQNQAFNFGSDALNAMQDSQNQAFDFGGDALAAMQSGQRDALDFGSDALQMTGNLAQDSINAQNALAETSIIENSDLARGVAELAENMHGNNTAFANNAILTVSDSIGDANNNMADLAYFTANNSSDLARDFAAGSADLSAMAIDAATAATHDAYEDAADQTLSAHTQALQFAENAMRSDGQQLAISTNETMKYIVIGLGGVAILAVVFMGRK